MGHVFLQWMPTFFFFYLIMFVFSCICIVFTLNEDTLAPYYMSDKN